MMSLQVLFAALVLMSTAVHITLSNAVKGRDFHLAIMQCYPCTENYVNTSLFLSNPSNASAQVTITYLGISAAKTNKTIPAGNTTTVILPYSLQLQGALKHNKAALVRSSDDIYAQVVQDIDANGTSSRYGFLLLPTSSLTSDYVVATHCATRNCVFVVLSVQDHTDVTVFLRVDSGGQAYYEGESYSDNDVIQDRLNAAESLQVTCLKCDLTGTMVSSTHHVAVFSGGEFTQLHSDLSRDAVGEQMPPAEGLGCRYLLATVFEEAPLLSIVKVVPLAANQTFIYDDTEYTSPREREVFVFEGSSSQLVEIAGHDPLLVAQFLRAETKPKVLDVVMVLPVPEHLWSTSYRVYVPPEPTQSQDSFYLFLVAQAGDEELLKTPGFSASWLSVTTQGHYVMVTLRILTQGLLHVLCDDGCHPFWGLAFYRGSKRSAAFSLSSSVYSVTYDIATTEETSPQFTTTENQQSTSPDAISTNSGLPALTYAIPNLGITSQTSAHDDISVTPGQDSIGAEKETTHFRVMLTTEDVSSPSTTTKTSQMTSLNDVGTFTETVHPSLADSSPSILSNSVDISTHSVAITTPGPSDAGAQTETTLSSENLIIKTCQACRCVNNKQNKSKEVRERTINEAREAIRKTLSVNMTMLSSHRRRKESSPDDRQTSAAIGASLGIACMAVLLVFLVGTDVVHVFRFFSGKKTL